jgi:hypothetical protein
MIFLHPANNNPSTVIYLDKYTPYRIYGMRNPHFTTFSGLILDLKEGKPNGIDHFYNVVNRMLNVGIAIAVVPSHNPANIDTGIRKLAIRLAQNGRYDATSCLVRTKMIEKLAHGGSRDKEVHLNSIEVRNSHIIHNKEVLLMDDVTTSNNSLLACRELLLKAGASVVQCFALAQTEGY